jgi:hypothetical protein
MATNEMFKPADNPEQAPGQAPNLNKKLGELATGADEDIDSILEANRITRAAMDKGTYTSGNGLVSQTWKNTMGQIGKSTSVGASSQGESVRANMQNGSRGNYSNLDYRNQKPLKSGAKRDVEARVNTVPLFHKIQEIDSKEKPVTIRRYSPNRRSRLFGRNKPGYRERVIEGDAAKGVRKAVEARSARVLEDEYLSGPGRIVAESRARGPGTQKSTSVYERGRSWRVR